MHLARIRGLHSSLLFLALLGCDPFVDAPAYNDPDVTGIYESTEFTSTYESTVNDLHQFGVLIRLVLHPGGRVEREIWTGATYTFAEGTWTQDRHAIDLEFDQQSTFTEQVVGTLEFDFDADRFRGAGVIGVSEVDILFVRMPDSIPIRDRFPR